MQISLTHKKLKNRRKNKIKSVITTILVFLFAIVSSGVLISIKKKNLVFDEREIYFISVASSKKESELETKSELLKNLGGANIIYNRNGTYYLVANSYLKLADAEEIKNNLISYFPECMVLKVKTKAVSKKAKKVIKGSDVEKIIRTLYELSKDFQNLQMGYLSGGIAESGLISSMVKYRLELENLNKISSVESEELTIVGFCEMFSLQMSNFLTNFVLSKSKQNYVCNYFVGFYINFIEMYDCL